jgi:tetratricopeptide (TPR) repeat protein
MSSSDGAAAAAAAASAASDASSLPQQDVAPAGAAQQVGAAALLDRVSKIKEEANALFLAHDLKNACAKYGEAHAAWKAFPHAADGAAAAGDDAGAVAAARRVVALCMCNSAQGLLDLGEHEQAAAAARASIALDDSRTLIKSRYRLGEALMMLSRFEGALNAFRSAAAITSADPALVARAQQLVEQLEKSDVGDPRPKLLTLFSNPRDLPPTWNLSTDLWLWEYVAKLGVREEHLALDDPWGIHVNGRNISGPLDLARLPSSLRNRALSATGISPSEQLRSPLGYRDFPIGTAAEPLSRIVASVWSQNQSPTGV